MVIQYLTAPRKMQVYTTSVGEVCMLQENVWADTICPSRVSLIFCLQENWEESYEKSIKRNNPVIEHSLFRDAASLPWTHLCNLPSNPSMECVLYACVCMRMRECVRCLHYMISRACYHFQSLLLGPDQ